MNISDLLAWSGDSLMGLMEMSSRVRRGTGLVKVSVGGGSQRGDPMSLVLLISRAAMISGKAASQRMGLSVSKQKSLIYLGV